MTLSPLFKGITNSPDAALTNAIDDAVTTIPVSELGYFLVAPNTATMYDNEGAETIHYTGKSATTGAGNLTGATRGFDVSGTYGAAKAWVINTKIARLFTRYDYDNLVDHITAAESGLGNLDGGSPSSSYAGTTVVDSGGP